MPSPEKEKYHETLQKKIKTELQQKSKEEVVEASSTTEESLDGDRYFSFLQKLEQKYKIERKAEQKDGKNEAKRDTRGTQTQNAIPQVLKTFYDESRCDLIFQMQINGEVVEIPRLELLQKDPKLILYFYEKHIEFTDPFDGGEALVLDKL